MAVEAEDDAARERLARYCLRPPFALGRMTELDDGRIAYRLRYPIGGATHRILEPMELMARLAALIAPPRRSLVRYFGVLSSHSSWRKLVVPRLPDKATDKTTVDGAPPQAPSSETANPRAITDRRASLAR